MGMENVWRLADLAPFVVRVEHPYVNPAVRMPKNLEYDLEVARGIPALTA